VPSRETLKLRLIPLAQLIPHEETVPHLSDKLSRRMIHDSVQRDPILVDEESKIVLDGMHRLESLKRMGVPKAVCSLVDYMGDGVKLFRWFRFVENPRESLVSEMLTELGLTEEVSFSLDEASLSRGLILTYRGKAFSSKRAEEAESGVTGIRSFDRVARRAGAWVEYIDESTVSPGLLKGDYMALLTPRLKKEDVVRAGIEGRPFPPKTTLHVFPVRPMGVNYPIEALRSEEDNLERILATRRRRRIDPPSFYRGRLYREPVVVFE